MNDLGPEQVKEFDNFWDTSTSYILNSFSLNDPDMTYNYLVIIVTMVVWICICYFFMKQRLKLKLS